jgi:hypothetical protein
MAYIKSSHDLISPENTNQRMGANMDFWIYQILGGISISCRPVTAAVIPWPQDHKLRIFFSLDFKSS